MLNDVDFSFKRAEKLKHFAKHISEQHFTLDPGATCTKYIAGPKKTINPRYDFQLYNQGTANVSTATDFFGNVITAGGCFKGQYIILVRHHGQLAKNATVGDSNTALTYCQVELGVEMTHIVEYGFPVFQSPGVGRSTQLYNVTGDVGKHSTVTGTGAGGKFKIVNDMLDQIEEVDEL